MKQNKELFPRKVVVVMFYDRNLNLLVQKRNTHSKVGERFGFFGGEIEEGETAEQALRRELSEELNYGPKHLKYWGKYSFTIDLPGSEYDGNTRYGELFLSPVTSKLMESTLEGDTEMALLPMNRVLENKNKEFGPVRFNGTSKIKERLIKLTNSRG